MIKPVEKKFRRKVSSFYNNPFKESKKPLEERAKLPHAERNDVKEWQISSLNQLND